MQREVLYLKSLPKSFTLKSNEKLDVFFYHTGNIKKDIILKINLLGKNASFNLYGAVFLNKNQRLNLSTYSLHKSPNTFARINIKTVLTDYANFNFMGMIDIGPKSFYSDSYLQQDNLVLSDNVVCNTSPQLEIKANDVKASHGATVGNIEPLHLYYLKSRGLDYKQSVFLISNGFLSSVYGTDASYVLKKLNLKNFLN